MKNNTSFHKLNADAKLGKMGRALWFLLNIINNKYFPNRVKNLNIASFHPNLENRDWDKISFTASPARAFSDLFWLKVNWNIIKAELGDINIFDAGTGNGQYSLKLNDFAHGIKSYFGIDIFTYKEWESLINYPNIIMKKYKSNEILNIIPNKTNFFITQSAIEHFDNDYLYFKQIKTFISKTNNDTIQIHLFLSAACLKLYRGHGIRQYIPRTISKIVNLFDSRKTYSILFKLGGKNCYNLHYKFITKPLLIKGEDYRDSKTKEYRELLKIAVKKDIENNNNLPIFYALVIHSNFKDRIFINMESLLSQCM